MRAVVLAFSVWFCSEFLSRWMQTAKPLYLKCWHFLAYKHVSFDKCLNTYVFGFNFLNTDTYQDKLFVHKPEPKLTKEIWKGTDAGASIPAVYGSVFKNKGVQASLDAVFSVYSKRF